MTTEEISLLTPPLRFSMMQPDLYRGSYPRPINHKFLKRLKLKTIVSLIPKPITEESDPILWKFCHDEGIMLIHIVAGVQDGKGKKRSVPLTNESVIETLEVMINSDYSPMYIHCLNGSQVTSLTVACLRKLSFWSSASIFNEFIAYGQTLTARDRKFVEDFKASITLPEHKVGWIWMGMSSGVVGSHPSVKFKERDENEQLGQKHLPTLSEREF